MADKPRIVHVYKDFWPPVLGGIERSINWMIQSTGGEFDYSVLVNSRQRESRKQRWNGIPVYKVGEYGRVLSAPLSPSFPRTMKRLKADIWHFHLPNPTADVSWLLSRPKGKVVATYHSDVVRQKWAMAVYKPFLDQFLKNCDAILPTSPLLVQYSEVLKKFEDKCHPIPLGMPMMPFERSEEKANRGREIKRRFGYRPLMIFVGKLRYYKGLQFMVSAMRGISKGDLLIIGDGPEREKLGRLVEEFKLEDRVHFLGELSDQEVIDHLFAADVFVMPSHLTSEAYGLSQIEAMACGLPVISCKLKTGVPYVNLHGLTGLSVEPANDVALAEAANKLLNDDRLRFKLGETAMRRAHDEFSLYAMGTRLKKIYRKVLNS